MADLTLLQLVAASALIETIEKQCRDGIHPEAEEMRLRELIAKACHAFKIPTIAEREYSEVIGLVHREMRAPA